MNRNDIKIMYVLNQEEAFDEFHAMTASSIAKKSEFCGAKVRATLRQFLAEGYVGNGYKKAQAATFYLTESGKAYLGKFPSL